jgi:hypothetical protein
MASRVKQFFKKDQFFSINGLLVLPIARAAKQQNKTENATRRLPD